MRKEIERPSYTSKVCVEVTIEHYTTAKDIAECVLDCVSHERVPAVTTSRILSVESNYQLFGAPLPEMIPVEYSERSR